MQDFDFDKVEVTKENHGEEEYDFSQIFGKDEPAFDEALLDEPVGDYGDDDEDEENPNFGVAQPKNPRPKTPSGSHAKDLKEKELVMV